MLSFLMFAGSGYNATEDDVGPIQAMVKDLGAPGDPILSYQGDADFWMTRGAWSVAAMTVSVVMWWTALQASKGLRRRNVVAAPVPSIPSKTTEELEAVPAASSAPPAPLKKGKGRKKSRSTRERTVQAEETPLSSDLPAPRSETPTATSPSTPEPLPEKEPGVEEGAVFFEEPQTHFIDSPPTCNVEADEDEGYGSLEEVFAPLDPPSQPKKKKKSKREQKREQARREEERRRAQEEKKGRKEKKVTKAQRKVKPPPPAPSAVTERQLTTERPSSAPVFSSSSTEGVRVCLSPHPAPSSWQGSTTTETTVKTKTAPVKTDPVRTDEPPVAPTPPSPPPCAHLARCDPEGEQKCKLVRLFVGDDVVPVTVNVFDLELSPTAMSFLRAENFLRWCRDDMREDCDWGKKCKYAHVSEALRKELMERGVSTDFILCRACCDTTRKQTVAGSDPLPPQFLPCLEADANFRELPAYHPQNRLPSPPALLDRGEYTCGEEVFMLPMCPEDEVCAFVNDASHQAQYAHTCRIPYCDLVGVDWHTRFFYHPYDTALPVSYSKELHPLADQGPDAYSPPTWSKDLPPESCGISLPIPPQRHPMPVY